MLKLKNSQFAWIFGVFLLLAPLRSEAARSYAHSFGCLAMLEQVLMSDNLLAGSSLGESEKFALNSIQAFGKHTLGVLDVPGGDPNLFVHSGLKATPSLISQVSERFAAIEFDRNHMHAESDGRAAAVIALSLTDPQKIKHLLKGTKARGARYKAGSRFLPLVDLVENASQMIMPLGSLAVVVSAAVGGVDASQVIALTFFYLYERHIFSLYGYIKERNPDFESHLQKLEDVSENPGQWAVWSSTAMVDSRGFDQALQAVREQDHQSREETFDFLAVLARMAQQSQISRSAIGKWAMYVLSDVIVDNTSGEPELHVVLRFSRQKQRYLTKKKRADKAPAEEVFGQALPVPVRAR